MKCRMGLHSKVEAKNQVKLYGLRRKSTFDLVLRTMMFRLAKLF